jgi:hypothetical protein
VPFAVTVAEALPCESVVAVTVLFPPVNVPVAPDVGTVKVTVTPAAAAPPVITVAVSGKAKAVSMAVVCVMPPVALIDPADMFMS